MCFIFSIFGKIFPPPRQAYVGAWLARHYLRLAIWLARQDLGLAIWLARHDFGLAAQLS
jgi:hypothetical protein